MCVCAFVYLPCVVLDNWRAVRVYHPPNLVLSSGNSTLNHHDVLECQNEFGLAIWPNRANPDIFNLPDLNFGMDHFEFFGCLVCQEVV